MQEQTKDNEGNAGAGKIAGTADLESRVHELETVIGDLKGQISAIQGEDKVSIICFSGEWDKLFAALTLASGSLAMGKEVHLFFTFWAVAALRRKECLETTNKTRLQSMFNKMLPCGPTGAPLSKLHFGGLGKIMMRRVMKQKGIDDIDRLYSDVKELGGIIHLCDNTTELFGLDCKELDTGENSSLCGVATFLGHAFKSKMVLFI
jgi:peroxiredoxin family protein